MLPNKRSKPYRKQLLIGFCCLSLLVLALPDIQPVSTASPSGEARELMANGDALRNNWKEADLRKALAKYDQAAQLLTSTGDDANASLAMLKAASVPFYLSEFAGALRRYKNVVAVAEKTGDRLAQGRALSQMGRIESYMGNNYLAQQHVNQALMLLKPANNDSNPIVRSAYGEALVNAGEVSYSRGNFVKALDQFQEALGHLEQDLAVQARARRFIGYLNGSLGNLAGAESEIRRALELSKEASDKSEEGLALALLGIFHSFKGDRTLGIELHRQALEIFTSIGDRHSEAIARNGLGQIYEVLEERDVAVSYYKKALSLLEGTGSLDLVAVNAHSLAAIYLKAGKHDQALKYLDQSLKLSRAAGKRRSEANALSEIAMVYVYQNRPEDAARRFRELQEFYKASGDTRGQVIALNNYGKFLFDSGRNREALDAYDEALPLSEKVEDSDLLTTTLLNLSRAHQSLGNYDDALSHIERSLKIIEDLRADVGTPNLRASYFSGVRDHYDLCIEILMELHRVRPEERFAERAFLVNEKGRARSLVDLLSESRSGLRDGAAAELLARERQVSISMTKLAEYKWELSLDGKGNSDEAAEVVQRMAELDVQYQEIQAELRKQNPRQSPNVDFEFQDVAQVQKALQADTMLLEYSLGDKQSYLWAITSNSFQTYELPDRKTIEDAAKEFYELTIAPQKLVQTTDGDYQAKVQEAIRLRAVKARELSQMLLGQVTEQLGDKRLVFVTEGALHLVPIRSLPSPGNVPAGPNEPEKYLVQTHEIVRLPSMSTLLAQRASRKDSATAGRVVAVIADPVFSPGDDRVASQKLSPAVAHKASLSSSVEQSPAKDMLRGGSPARLIHSSKEADAISALAPRGTALIAKGFDASRETAMSRPVGEYQIVHFATHGFVDNEQPELSGIVLTMVDQNGAAKNGIMPLHDIYNLNLSAELTVLSACETALGEDVKGEGLVGLTHSFMSAGSRSVVASLWKVDDRATAVLMSHFYKAIFEDGLRPAAALSAAQLQMMQDKQWSAPHYWAGFVFQGDYESQIDVSSASNIPIVVGLVILVLVSLGVLLFVRHRRRSSPAETNRN